MSQSAVHRINIDGAARGNPGPAAFAYVISQDGSATIEDAERIGETTNNVAEYTALVRALERAAQLGLTHLSVRSDSELLVKQMNGEYRVKNSQLRSLYEQATDLCSRFKSVEISHVRREDNKRADALCNLALDGKQVRGAAAAKSPARKARRQTEGIREEALACLQAAAASWKRGDANAPTAEHVWDQLWSILEENGLFRKG